MLVISGCAVGPNYKEPELNLPARFGGPPSTQPVSVARWWETFNDPQLDSLIDRAAKQNLDLRAAEARVREARAQRGVVSADLFPQVDVNGSYQRARRSGSNLNNNFSDTGNRASEFDLYQAGFDASWELDVFGGTRRGIEAASADIESTVENLRDVRVTLLAEVGRNYVELRGFQRRLQFNRENLKAQQQTLDLTRSRFQSGLTSDLDVARAEAQVATTASAIPTFETQAAAAMHRLAVLLGQNPRALMDELNDIKPVAKLPTTVPSGLPSELVRRRPDVRRAERDLAAQTARIGVAVADWFPKFSLTGSLGRQSDRFKDLGNSDSQFWTVGPSISWPILDWGRIRSNIAVENARQEQSLANYESAVLVALEDVENALVAYEKEQARRTVLSDAVAANRRAVDLSTQLYSRGLADFLNVLDAQRSLFLSQDALAQSDAVVSSNLVALYKALGGGWELEDGDAQPTTQPAKRQVSRASSKTRAYAGRKSSKPADRSTATAAR